MATATNPSRHDPPQPERIYIGGLDPPFLKPSDVIQRLEESLPTISVVQNEMDDTKSYVHIDAHALTDEKAFDVISKAYNNVKWKGCRLTVQPARPHFLQRLEEERRARVGAKIQSEATAASCKEDAAAVAINAKPVLRRRLRIRQRYATEAHRVDTKPCHTTDWNSFDKIVRQMRIRRDRTPNVKKKKGVATEKTQAFYSRAVHLKFGADGEAPMLVDSDMEHDVTRKDGDDANAVDAEGDESSEDASDDSNEEIVLQEMKQEAYDWSTDDSCDNDKSDDDSIDNAATKREPIVTNDEGLVDSYHRDVSKPYDWSTDESDVDPLVEARPTKVHPTASEFESAIDFDESDQEPIEVIPSDDDASEPTDHATLQKDVETNLDVLSQLFPDLKDVTPKHISKAQASQQIGWSASSMQRYDPTKESSQQFELEVPKGKVTTVDVDDESEEDRDENSDESDGDDEDDEDASVCEDKNERMDESVSDKARNDDQAVSESPTEPLIKKVVEGNVYRESQLEEVFRNARDSGQGGGFQVSALFGEQADELKGKEKHKNDATSTFSFNFDVAVTQADIETKLNDGFSVVNEVSPVATSRSTKGDDLWLEPGDIRADQATTDTIRPKKRRRGLMLPDSVVEHYYNTFFELNDGLAIQQDPDGFRNDETVKADWTKERHALTQDWKRKRKYALSRSQKNNKFRK